VLFSKVEFLTQLQRFGSDKSPDMHRCGMTEKIILNGCCQSAFLLSQGQFRPHATQRRSTVGSRLFVGPDFASGPWANADKRYRPHQPWVQGHPFTIVV